MQIGIFAKTFPGTEPLGVLSAVRDSGYACAQFNLACCGLPSMPDAVSEETIAAVRSSAEATGISLAALSGTYNMAHPDTAVRRAGLAQLAVVIETAAALDSAGNALHRNARPERPMGLSSRQWRSFRLDRHGG